VLCFAEQDKMSLINQLLKKGIISKKAAISLERDVERSERTEEELILEKKIASEEDLFKLKSKTLNVSLQKSLPSKISSEVLEFIPKESAEYYKMIPLRKKGDMLEMAMVYPEDLKAQEALNFLSRQKNFTYRVVLITLSDFQVLLKHYQTLGKEVKLALQELERQLQPGKPEVLPATPSELVQKRSEAPISKTVAVILKHAVEGGASDIHIEPLKTKTRVRFRLDGILHASLFLPKEIHPSVVARIKIISKLKIDETRIPQDGRFSITMDDQNIDFRVSTFPTTLGEKVVMRVLSPASRFVSFEDLGLEGRNLEIIEKTIKKPYGMILATGPTGSGKTTTLYVILESVNKEQVNIATLEDPVEYFIGGVSQSQVKPEIGYTFATGLRHIVRQDPDIIMVGEIRDTETAELATHAALTGHIVLSTVHTNNALGVIPRLIDLGVRSFLLPQSINAALAQRLVRKLCPHCKQKIKPKAKIKELIVEILETLPLQAKKDYKFDYDFSIWEPVGCSQCGGSGYADRIGIFEVIIMTKELAEIILSEPSEKKIGEEAKRQGMITMRQDGILKVLRGETSIEEVIRITAEE
jgi:type IV pilus assembly protein PilB